MLFIKLIKESYFFAIQAIVSNRIRTILSLLSITIGIFTIITVFTIVDTMGSAIRGSIKSLGDNVLFVEKWPWSFDSDYPWWKYLKRPVSKYTEVAEIEKHCNSAEVVVFMISMNKTIKYESNSIEDVSVMAVSQNYDKVKTIELSDGRYFSLNEINAGRNVVIVGAHLVETFFPTSNPIPESVNKKRR